MIKTLLALATCTLLFAYFGSSPMADEKFTTPGTLYTGLPDSDDDYYADQQANLKKFSNLMTDNANEQLQYGDVWLRDIAPVITNNAMVKFKYEPNYLDPDFVADTNTRFDNWLDQQSFDLTYSDIRLDGGNFVYNDKDTAILTKRVLEDNPEYSEQELISLLKKQLKIKNIILINEEPGDVMGHADGMLFFIQPDVLFIGNFEGVDKVKKQIKQAQPHLKLVDLPSAYTDKGQYDDTIPSAKGLYTNMLATEDQIFVPQYKLSADKKVLKLVESYTDKKVIPVPVSEISTMGGSVHCLTWYVPKNRQ